MLLCLDIGNTHIFGGVLIGEEIKLRFRYTSSQESTSDQLGLFLKNVLRENAIKPSQIKQISLCSVVPALDYSVTSACIKYFDIEPFSLCPGVKTGLKILLTNPSEVGADRIANAIAAEHYFPSQDILVIDFGTATTCSAISAQKEYLGGVIMPGVKITMHALHSHTNKLFPVEIIKPDATLGKTTKHNMQSGVYYGHLGAIKEIIKNLTGEVFQQKPPVVIGTGGFAHLFKKELIFSAVMPDLILQGLRLVFEKNCHRL